MAVADRCSVLRKGKYIGTVDIANATKEELSEMMVGRKVEFVVDKKTGLLVKNIEDPEEYAKKIRYLFEHKDEASKFARNASKWHKKDCAHTAKAH